MSVTNHFWENEIFQSFFFFFKLHWHWQHVFDKKQLVFSVWRAKVFSFTWELFDPPTFSLFPLGELGPTQHISNVGITVLLQNMFLLIRFKSPFSLKIVLIIISLHILRTYLESFILVSKRAWDLDKPARLIIRL